MPLSHSFVCTRNLGIDTKSRAPQYTRCFLLLSPYLASGEGALYIVLDAAIEQNGGPA